MNTLKKIRYFLSVASMYGLTVLIFWLFTGSYLIPPKSKLLAQTFTVPKELRESPAPTKIVLQGKPVHISVPSARIDLDLLDGKYNHLDKSWTLSENKPHFALPTAPSNDTAGNTFIYGHNNSQVFGALPALKKGDIAKITTENGLVFTYVFANHANFNPGDTSIFSYAGPPILTLQTCTGAWNEKRGMFTFNFQSVE